MIFYSFEQTELHDGVRLAGDFVQNDTFRDSTAKSSAGCQAVCAAHDPESELPPATGVGFDIIQRQACPPWDWTEEWESGARHVYYGNVFVQDLIPVQVLSSS